MIFALAELQQTGRIVWRRVIDTHRRGVRTPHLGRQAIGPHRALPQVSLDGFAHLRVGAPQGVEQVRQTVIGEILVTHWRAQPATQHALMFLGPGFDRHQPMILRGDDVRAEPVGQLTITQPLPIAMPRTQVGIHNLGHTHALQHAQGQGQRINPFRLNAPAGFWHRVPRSSQS